MTLNNKVTALCVLSLCLLLAAACSAWSEQTVLSQGAESSAHKQLLNSERIRRDFGSYGIDIMEQGDNRRVSNLYSFAHDLKVTRTLAVVFYPASIASGILAEHREILAGGSIGEVFKSHGWKIEKTNRYFGEIPPSADFEGVYTAMGGLKASKLAIHIYQLSVSKNEQKWMYATIAEVHHPEYLNLGYLREVYQVPNENLILTVDEVRTTLDEVSRVMQRYQ